MTYLKIIFFSQNIGVFIQNHNIDISGFLINWEKTFLTLQSSNTLQNGRLFESYQKDSKLYMSISEFLKRYSNFL